MYLDPDPIRGFEGNTDWPTMVSETDEELALIVEVQCRGKIETVLVPYREGEDLLVGGLRRSIASQYDHEPEEVWLVFKGRKIRDEESAAGLGIENYSKLFMGVDNKQDSSEETSPSTTTSPEAGATLPLDAESGRPFQSPFAGVRVGLFFPNVL